MKIIIFACILAGVLARPDSRYDAPQKQSSFNEIEIVRDDRVHPDAGSYSFNVETEDGIERSEYGSPLNIDENPTGQRGAVSFTFPNGEKFELKFVADENGYQPESSWLPVAPAFPHEIPQFVLDQIEKAAREDAEGHRAAPSSPNRRYDFKRK